VSIFSKFYKVNWIADVLTPSTVILMEVLWLYPWLVFIGKLLAFTVHPTPLSLLSLIFLLVISYVATKFFLKRKWSMLLIQMSIVACGLVAISLVLRIEYSTGFQLFSGQWFVSYGKVLLDTFSNLHPFVFALVAGLYLWWRGIIFSRSPLYFDNIYTTFLIELATLVFLIIIWGLSFKAEPLRNLTSDIGIYIAGFFFFGLVAMALSNLKVVQEKMKTKGESSKTFGRRWLTIILVVIGGMVLLGIGLGSVFSSQLVSSLERILNLVSDALYHAVYYLVWGLIYTIGFVVEWIYYGLQWILNWISHLTKPQPFQPTQISNPTYPKGPNPSAFSPQLVLILKLTILLLILTAVLFLIIRTVRRRHSIKTDEDLAEEHESLWSWDGFKSDIMVFFKMIFQRFQRKARPVPAIVLSKWQPEEDINRKLSVREIYQHLLWQGARSRIPRESYETPSEYARRLGQFVPDIREPLAQITNLYMHVRYGEDKIEEKKIDDANAVWERLLKLLKRLEGK